MVHGPGNEPGSDGQDVDHAAPSVEILLDLQVVGSGAQGQDPHLFPSSPSRGWVDAINMPAASPASYHPCHHQGLRSFRQARDLLESSY